MRPTHRPGETFAGYVIEEQLGRGGMSEVFRARNPRLGNLVALKLLSPDLTEDELFRERFVRESQIAASLNHPNVIPILDAGEEDGVPYIAMRYVDGPNLGELIQRGELPLAHTVSIVGQVAGALDAAHERGLIHRDVKPANILIDRYTGLDSAPHVYLSDFGVAKHTLSRSGLTTTGQFVGTIDYVAPEQIEGKTVDRRTDVYSLGCVFYESLTGIKPFDRESNVAVMYAHLLEPPPAPSELREGLPPEMDAVVEKALAKSADDRYSTCGELAAAGRAALGGTGAAEPESIVTAPLLEIDSGTGMVAQPLPPPATPPPAPPRTARKLSFERVRRLPKIALAAVVVLAFAGAGFAAVQNLTGAGTPDRPTTEQTPTTTEGPPGEPPPARVAVPRLTGLTRREAVARLRRLRLRPTVRLVHATRRKGTVLAQAPRRGTRLVKGTRVRLTVSKGRRAAPPPPPPPPPPHGVPAPPPPPDPGPPPPPPPPPPSSCEPFCPGPPPPPPPPPPRCDPFC